MFKYNPLWKTLIDKGIKKSKFYSDISISSSVRTKLNNNMNVGMDILDKICCYLDVPIEEVIEWERDIKITRDGK